MDHLNYLANQQQELHILDINVRKGDEDSRYARECSNQLMPWWEVVESSVYRIKGMSLSLPPSPSSHYLVISS